MPVPSSITDLSTNPIANSPQGSESAKGTIDDYLRAGFAFMAQLNALVSGPTITLASSTTVSIGAATSLNISITGNSTITAFDTTPEGALRWVTFAGAPIIVHNATNLQLPGSANIGAAAGDTALFKSLGGGNWKCLGYQRANGAGIVAASSTKDGFLSFNDWNLFNGKLSPAVAAATYLPIAGGTMIGNLTFANNTGIYAKDSGGTSYQQMVLAADNNTYITNIGNQNFYFQNRSGTILANLNNSGTFSATTITQTSDERKKKRWQRLPGDFIERLAGIRKSGMFQWKKGGGPGLGVGAQSLEQILPLAVHTDEKGAKTVNYGAAAMVTAVELARAMVDVQARLAKLEVR